MRVDECLLHVLAHLVPHEALEHPHVVEAQAVDHQVAVLKNLQLLSTPLEFGCLFQP